MNITIPFSKDLPFKTKIAEICSISLEQDVSINEKELLGDFIISGDYKNLDINVDTVPFSFVIPFSVDLENDIDLDTLKYEIYDFKYDILDDEILNIMISFHVEADKNNNFNTDIFERVDKEELLKSDELNVSSSKSDTNNLLFDDEKINDINDSNNSLDSEREDNSANLISSNNLEEDYITYHIHMVKLNDTIESISKEYRIDKDELVEINDITNINIGDKLIIPINNETE